MSNPPSFPNNPTGPANIPTYLVQSILVTVFCCLPFGIVGIVFASQVSSKLAAGDIAGAQASSQQAKKWCMIGAGIGVVLAIIWGIMIAVGGVASMHLPAQMSTPIPQ